MLGFDNKIDLAGEVVKKSEIKISNGKKTISLGVKIPSISDYPQTIRFCNDYTVNFINQYVQIGDYIGTTGTMCGYFTNDRKYRFAILSDNIFSNKNFELFDNNVHLLGRVGGKINTYNTSSGKNACSFYLYVKDKFHKNADDYVFKVQAFEKQCDFIMTRNINKGTLVDLKGYLTSSVSLNQSGQTVFYDIFINKIRVAESLRNKKQQNTNYSNNKNIMTNSKPKYDESNDLIYEQSQFNLSDSEFRTDLPF